MSLNKYQIKGLFKGKVKPLKNGQLSAIQKSSVDSLLIQKMSIPGDDVAEKKYHGGELRVIHHYTQKNYDHLMKVFPDIAERFVPGSFGENIFTEELTEKDLCVGDVFRLGTAKIQLTACRRPCATLNASYEDKRILKEVVKSGHVGWFYRVIEEGEVKVGDDLEYLERPYPELSISYLFEQGYDKERYSDLDFLKRCLETGLMEKGWKPTIEGVLKT